MSGTSLSIPGPEQQQQHSARLTSVLLAQPGDGHSGWLRPISACVSLHFSPSLVSSFYQVHPVAYVPQSFVLRATDPVCPEATSLWASLASLSSTASPGLAQHQTFPGPLTLLPRLPPSEPSGIWLYRSRLPINTSQLPRDRHPLVPGTVQPLATSVTPKVPPALPLLHPPSYRQRE